MSAPALDVRLVAYTAPLVQPLLVELDREYTARYGHTLGDLRAEARRGAAEFGPPDGGLLLLLLAGVPVAGGAFRRFDERTAELKRIWTGSAHRRQGLARRVLAELEREISVRGYRRIYLTTGPRQPEAKGLYLASGYTPLYDPRLPAEQIGPHPFEKEIRQ
ncbi:GNAT family N-acetyltransferase [Pseudonocardia sp. MH-G8]|uniref:GNAT family N-acetyltransferase n=1 Tax=Pseudonocardia sp. MH-G8 TaxID=1854588 RepID=UPI0018E9FE94|nr:GNAT family N-acetyltransferase [Pseudonocardia sp. MH-G8]